MITKSKTNILKEILDPTLPVKTLWKNFKSPGVGKSKAASQQISFSHNELNIYFTFMHSTNFNASHYNIFKPCTSSTKVNTEFANIDEIDLIESINLIKTNVVGLDNIK